MKSEILETIEATILGLGMQIPEIPAQRKFSIVPPTYRLTQKNVCHAHFNAHKPQKIVNMNVHILETIKDRELRSQI